MYLHKVSAGLDEAGQLIVWQQRIVGQSIVAGTPFEKMLVQGGVDRTSSKARRICRTTLRIS